MRRCIIISILAIFITVTSFALGHIGWMQAKPPVLRVWIEEDAKIEEGYPRMKFTVAGEHMDTLIVIEGTEGVIQDIPYSRAQAYKGMPEPFREAYRRYYRKVKELEGIIDG